MASFLDKLAASWGGGYDVDEMARQRAMNDALMNLGTTLMMAGGSGSWQNAAPMLAQAVPSAMGAFRQNLNEEEKRAMLLEERRRREEDYERKRLQEERQDILWERNEKQRVSEMEAAEKDALALTARAGELVLMAKEDPDVTPDNLAAFENAVKTSAEMYALTKNRDHLDPLREMITGFESTIKRSENEAMALESAAKKALYPSYEAAVRSRQEADSINALNKQSMIDSREEVAKAKAEARLADERLKEAAANGGFLGIENGFALITNKETGEVEAFPATAAMTAYENNIQRRIDAATKQALSLFYDKDGDPVDEIKFAGQQYDLSSRDGRTNFANAASRFATKYGTKIATTPEELQSMAAALSNPDTIRAAVEAKIRAPKVALGEQPGQMRAMAEPSPQDQVLIDLFLRSSVDEQEKQLFQAALATGKPIQQIVQDFYNIRLRKSGQTP